MKDLYCKQKNIKSKEIKLLVMYTNYVYFTLSRKDDAPYYNW